MNDYFFYICASYSITAVALIAGLLWPLWQRRRILRALHGIRLRHSQLEKRRQ
jgi:heme exporter protein CcmD